MGRRYYIRAKEVVEEVRFFIAQWPGRRDPLIARMRGIAATPLASAAQRLIWAPGFLLFLVVFLANLGVSCEGAAGTSLHHLKGEKTHRHRRLLLRRGRARRRIEHAHHHQKSQHRFHHDGVAHLQIEKHHHQKSQHHKSQLLHDAAAHHEKDRRDRKVREEARRQEREKEMEEGMVAYRQSQQRRPGSLGRVALRLHGRRRILAKEKRQHRQHHHGNHVSSHHHHHRSRRHRDGLLQDFPGGPRSAQYGSPDMAAKYGYINPAGMDDQWHSLRTVAPLNRIPKTSVQIPNPNDFSLTPDVIAPEDRWPGLTGNVAVDLDADIERHVWTQGNGPAMSGEWFVEKYRPVLAPADKIPQVFHTFMHGFETGALKKPPTAKASLLKRAGALSAAAAGNKVAEQALETAVQASDSADRVDQQVGLGKTEEEETQQQPPPEDDSGSVSDPTGDDEEEDEAISEVAAVSAQAKSDANSAMQRLTRLAGQMESSKPASRKVVFT